MKKIISLFATLLFFSHASFAEESVVVRFATEATYPPFEYVNEAGQIQGFDIEIAKALCLQMKVQCTFSNQAFNSLIPSLALGKFDAIISALGITKEREKQVAFTHSYYEPSGSFVGALIKKYNLNQLKGKTIGVQSGSTYEKYMHDLYGTEVTLKIYASIQDALLDLKSERIDMVLADTPIIQAWLQQENNKMQYGIVDQPIINETYFGAGYGIAVRKDNTTLLNALNAALSTIKANGTYAKIAHQYFNQK